MFSKMKEWIRKVMNKLIPKADIKKAIKADIAISNEMVQAIEEWRSIYENKAYWLNDDEGVFSLELASTICSEFARQVTIEMESEIKNNEFLNDQYKYVLDDLRENTEYMCAGGGLVFKPYISNDEIIVDYVQSSDFYPITYDSRKRITSAVFPEIKIDGKKRYTKLELHKFENNTHTITNTAFVSDNENTNSNMFASLGTPCALASVAEWADLEEEGVIENVERPLFSYVRVPGSNNIDMSSPLGLSIFKKAIPLIREADKQYGRLIWEFEGGELALDVSEDLMEMDTSTNEPVLPKNKKRLYRVYDGETKGGNIFNTFAPALRDVNLLNGFNNILKRIEFNVGLSYGTISDPNNTDKTATEIKISKQRMYSTVCDIQKALEKGLEDTAYIMNIYAVLLRKSNSPKVEVTFAWDDSILTDSETQRLQDLQEVRDGLLPEWKYKVKWQNLTKNEAKAEVTEKQGLKFNEDE